jgi:hypothetical protein
VFSASGLFSPNGKRRPRTGLLGGASTVTRSFAPPVTSLTARALLPLSSILKEVHAADEIESLLCSELNDQIARLKGVGAQYRRHLATVRERNMSALPAHIAGGLRDPLIKATGTLRHADGLLPDADTRLRMLLSRAFVGGFERAVRDASMAVLQFEHALGIAVAALDELMRQQRERAAAEARRKAVAEAERAREEAEVAAAAAALATSTAAAMHPSLASSWGNLQSGIAAAAVDTSRSDNDSDDDWSPTAMKPLDHRLSAVGLAQAPYIIDESGDAGRAEQDRRAASVVGRSAASTPAGTAGLRGLGSPVAASPTVSHYWRLISPQAVGTQPTHRQQRTREMSASRSAGHGRSNSDGAVEGPDGNGDNCAGSATLTASDAPSFMPLDARLAAAPVSPPPAASAHSPPPDTSRATVSQQQRSVQLRSPIAAVRWAQSRGSLHAIEERSVDTSDGDGDGADAAAAAAAGQAGSARQQAQATARTDTSRHGSVTAGSSSLPPSVRQQRGSLIRSPTVSRVSAGNLSVDDGLSMLDAVDVGPDDSASCLGVFARKAQTALESHSRDVTLATSTQALAGVAPPGGVVAVDGHVRMQSRAHQAAVPQPTAAPPPPPALGSKAGSAAAAAAAAVAGDEITPVVVADGERAAAGQAAAAATSPEKRQLPSLRAVAKAAVFASTFVPGMLRKKTGEGGDSDATGAPKRRRPAAGEAAGGDGVTSPSSATGVGAAHAGPKNAWLSPDGQQTAEGAAELPPHPPSRGILSPSSQAGVARGAAAGAGTSTNASSGRGTATGGLAVSSVTSPTHPRSLAAGSAPFVTSPTATERERQLERELEVKNAQLQAALTTAAALSAVVQASQAGGDGAGASTARSGQNSGRRSSGAGASAAAGSAASGTRGAAAGAAAASAGVGGRTRVRSPAPGTAEESEGETGREALAREEASYVLALEHILLAKRAAHKLAARTRARRAAAAAGTEGPDAKAAAPRKQAPPPLPTREPISPAEGRHASDAPGSGRRPRSPASVAREATVSPSAAGDRHSHRSPQGHHRQQQSGGSGASGVQAGRGAATVAIAASKLLRLRSGGQAAHAAAAAAGPSPTAAAAGGVLHIPTPGRSDGRAPSSTRGAGAAPSMHAHPASPANANGSFGLGGSGPVSSRGARDQPSARAAVDGVTGLSGRRGFFKSASEEESFLSGLSDEDGAVVMTARDGVRAHAPSGSGGGGGASTRDAREALHQQRPLSSTRGGMRGHGQAGSGVAGVSASLAAMASEGGLIPKPLDSTRASIGPGSGRGGGYSHPLSTRGAGPSGAMVPTTSFRVSDGRRGDRSSRSQEPAVHVAPTAAAAAKGRSTSNARGGGAGSVAPSVVSAVLSGSGRPSAHHKHASSAASAAPTSSPGDVFGDGRRASGAAGVPASTFTVSAPGSSRPVSVVIPSGGSVYPGSPGVPGGSSVLALPQPGGAPQAGSLRSVTSSAAMHLVPVMLDGRTVYLPSAAAAEYGAPPAGYMYSTSATSGAGTGGAGGAYMTTMPAAPGPLLRSVSSFAGVPSATVQVGPASVMGMQPPAAVLPTPRGGGGGAGALTGRSQAGSSRVASYLAHDNELRLKASGRPKLAHQPSAYDLARARETLGSDGPAAAAISVTDARMYGGGHAGVDGSGFSPTHGTASYVTVPAGAVAAGGMPYMGAVGGPTGIYSGAAGVPGMLPRAPTVMLLQPGAPGGFAAVGTTSAAGSLGYVSSVSQSTYAGAGGMPIGADMSALGSGRAGGGHMSLRSLSRQATAVSFLMKNRAAGDPQHSVRSSDRAITPPPNIKRAIL